MQLSWDAHEAQIAAALLDAYPHADRLALSLPELKQKIETLPGFCHGLVPPTERRLKAVLWNWMRLAGIKDDGDGGGHVYGDSGGSA